MHESYVELLEDAVAYGGSDQQIAVIDAAIERGTPITFEEYKQAKQREMDCIAALGFRISAVHEEVVYGVREISYLFGGFKSEAEGDALLDGATACEETHALYIHLARQSTPTQEERDAARAERTPAFIECLREDGAHVADTASWEDLLTADHEHTRAPDDRMCFDRLGLIEVP